jgi:hypothetical protein
VLPLSTLTSVSPLALGSATSQLVFTPIPPCRIADTRFSPFGPLLPFVPRAFDLTTDAFGKNQGGQLSCPGLPSFSFYSWSVNITATGYSTSGYVQVYPFAGAFPSTSILNFGPALPAIANSSTVTGCYGCIEDINVVASATTHIILDVYGYFELPTGFTTGVITKLAGTTTSLAPGAYLPIFGASCPAGTRVIGGAQTTSGTSANTPLTSDHNIDPSEPRWYEWVKNTGTTAAVSVTIYSICQDVS